MKQNKPHIELLPSPTEMARAPVQRAELNQLVQQKVAEILAAKDQSVFEPFFRSRQVAYELKRLQTVPEMWKWTVFFDRYGCLLCETRERIHAGNGMCQRCYQRTLKTLKQIIAEGIAGETARPSRNALPQNTQADPPARTHVLLPVECRVRCRWNRRRKRKRGVEKRE